MVVKILWQKPIPLGTKATFAKKLQNFDFATLPDEPGIYIFARKFAKKTLVPIYIGKAGSNGLRRRLKGQFNNYKLIEALKNEKSGERILLIGTIKGNSQKLIEKKTTLAEHAHVEQALTAGHPLINIQLTKRPAHRIEIVGQKSHNHPFPRVMLHRSR